MTCVLSDVHGHYGKYMAMLDAIGLRPEGALYVLGGVVDRGPEPMRILQNMMSRSTIRLLVRRSIRSYLPRHGRGVFRLKYPHPVPCRVQAYPQRKEAETGLILPKCDIRSPISRQ